MDLFEGGKWRKYHLLRLDEKLQAHLPETQLFTDENLWKLGRDSK